MATLSVIRRWALREQMSIREIARRTGLSRNTVKEVPTSRRRSAALRQAGELEQARSLCRQARDLARDRGHQIAETAAQSATDPHTSI